MVRYNKIVISGRERIRAWSDLGMKIERDGELYEEAVDPANSNRVYSESNVLITAVNEEHLG